LAAPHYVYVLCRPDGSPFYVGKGIGDRCLHHEGEARRSEHLTHKLNLIRSLHRNGLSVHYCIDSFFHNDFDAHARERQLIEEIGRHDLRRGPLTNQTAGGEGASNPSEESRQRRRDSLWGENAEDPERKIANRFFQKLTSVQSVTLKPGNWPRAIRLKQNRAHFPMTARQAATIAASAIANRVLLESGALLPRRLKIGDRDFIIESGVGRDMLSSGMVTLADATPTHEILLLTENGYRFILRESDHELLVDAGVLLPKQVS
jgi:hypothetical protein